MARRKRGRGRDEPEEAPLGRRGDDHGGRAPARTPKGLSFALPVGFAAGAGGALLAFVAVLGMARGAGGDSLAVLDEGGVAAVRLVASLDTGRWAAGFGTNKAARAHILAKMKDKLDAVVKASNDERNRDALQPHIETWKAGNPANTEDWRPGLDQFLPAADAADDLIPASLRKGYERVQTGNPASLHGVAIENGGRAVLYSRGEIFDGREIRVIGETRISAAKGYRIYQHPMSDRSGNPDGRATVVLSTARSKSASTMDLALAAGGGGFLGGFILGLLMCLGPVRSMQKFAGEVETIARGNYEKHVIGRGPKELKLAAKSVGRIASAALAGGDGGGGEPQVIHQPVPMVPLEDITAALSPTSTFERPPSLEIEATHKSCPDAGNDFYDIVNLPSGAIGLFIADIPVRGTAGALRMAQVKAHFRAESQKSDSPADVLRAVNREFARDLPRGVFATAMYAVLDPESGVCKVASAQHLPLVFWKLSKKSSARLATQGIAMGHDAGPVFDKTIEEKAIQLERGDRIVLFTDGAITARNAAGATYGEQRFYYVVNREAPKNSAAFVNFVANDVDLFHEGSPQLDDFTVVTVRKLA